MDKVEDFHINYWGPEELDYGRVRKQRSAGRKLFIVIAFILILGILPLLTLEYGYFRNSAAKKQVSQVINPISPSPTKNPTVRPKTTPASNPNHDVIVKGDSYWKIAKRNCGSGKYYLTIQNLNKSKPLQAGDSVLINCSL